MRLQELISFLKFNLYKALSAKRSRPLLVETKCKTSTLVSSNFLVLFVSFCILFLSIRCAKPVLDAIHRDPRRLLCHRISCSFFLILQEASPCFPSLSRIWQFTVDFVISSSVCVCAGNVRSRLTFCNGKINFWYGCRSVCK